jgi:outer membrane biosynthesis protein TonB
VKVKEDPQPMPEPQQAAPPKTEAPPSPQLAADSDGPGDLGGKAGGEDYVGNGVVGSPGGNGTGGGGTYRAFVVSELKRALMSSERLRAMRFKRVPVQVQVAGDGRIEKIELLESTGKADADRLLISLLQSVGRVSSPPPNGQSAQLKWLISPEV